MKTLIAAALAALTLASTSVATADPVYPAVYHHPVRHAVVVRAPVVYRHGLVTPGFYRTAYVHGHRGVRFHVRHHRHGPFHHHIAWRGAYVGEHRPG